MKTAYRCKHCGRSYPRRDWGCWCTGEYLKEFKRCRIAGPEDVPAGEHGDCRIEKVTFSERTNVGGNWHDPRFMNAGETVTMLKHGGKLWMSNTPDEVRSQRFEIVDRHPTILIGGLGLGSVISYIDGRCIPERVVVVEIDPDVIALVAPTYAHLDWLEVVEGDIRTYGKTGPRATFDVAWVDIWGNYNSDLLPDMYAVRRSLRRVMKPGGGRVQIWIEDLLKYYKRTGR